MRTYRIDKKEEATAELQRYLRAVSYRYARVPHVGIDGIYGEETQDAVRAFQLLFGLPATGKADALTFARLFAEYASVPRGADEKAASP